MVWRTQFGDVRFPAAVGGRIPRSCRQSCFAPQRATVTDAAAPEARDAQEASQRDEHCALDAVSLPSPRSAGGVAAVAARRPRAGARRRATCLPAAAARRCAGAPPLQSDSAARRCRHSACDAATLQPLAGFSVDARVLSREDYSSAARPSCRRPTSPSAGARWRDGLAERLDISQSSRWYHYQWSGEPPSATGEIARSSANMHMIPADAATARCIEVGARRRPRPHRWLAGAGRRGRWMALAQFDHARRRRRRCLRSRVCLRDHASVGRLQPPACAIRTASPSLTGEAARAGSPVPAAAPEPSATLSNCPAAIRFPCPAPHPSHLPPPMPIHRHPQSRISSGRSSARTWPAAGTRAIQTRFPPEPNGYLHIGHAKAICLDFGIAARVRRQLQPALRRHQPGEGRSRIRRRRSRTTCTGSASNGTTCAMPRTTSRCSTSPREKLIEDGEAFVCDLSAEQVREYRGTLTEPGRNSPYRDRSVDENLDLFRRMRAGEFADGARTLRAKIDMAAATSTCATRRCTASSTSSTRTPATPGRSIRCTTTRIRSATRSKASPIRCARWSSRTTARCTTGAWTRSTSRTRRNCWRRCSTQACRTKPASRARSSSRALNLNYTVMSKRKLMALVQRRPRRRLGRSAHADPAGHPPPRLHARGAAADGGSRRHQQAELAASTSRSWKARCATTSMPRRRGGWR